MNPFFALIAGTGVGLISFGVLRVTVRHIVRSNTISSNRLCVYSLIRWVCLAAFLTWAAQDGVVTIIGGLVGLWLARGVIFSSEFIKESPNAR